MCTASWLRSDAGYELFFNRDERRTRARGLPPRPARLRGVRFLAPIDLACGGSWLAVNELGVTLCLLNRYPDFHAPDAKVTSRGLLVLGMADAAGAADVSARLGESNLRAYRPFRLLVVEPGREVAAFAWAGDVLEESRLADDDFETSSSRDDDAARRSRLELWRRLRREDGGAGWRERFHRSHWPAASALSVCMHREDAESESFCHVRVGVERIETRYVAGPPCAGGAAVLGELARAVVAA